MIKNKFEQIKKESNTIRGEAKEKVVGYIVAAFGLVAGLAWNEAVRSLIETVFPQQENNLTAKFIYAIVISVIVVIVSLYLVRLTKKDDPK